MTGRSIPPYTTGIFPIVSGGGETCVKMAELVEQMDKDEDLDLFDAAARVNGWIEEALKENRKITISFKDAAASRGVMGEIIGDIYDRYPEKII
jgi:predicted RNA-binding Zn ribbon-like protein